MKNSWIIIVLILFGCKNNINDKSFENAPINNSDIEEVILDDLDLKPSFNELNIIEEKLQDAYDIIFLAQKSTNFKFEVKSSTFEDYENSLDTLKLKDAPEVSEIVQIGNSKIINDSITHVHFQYSIKSKQYEKTDTLKAIIKKQKLLIDNSETTSIKIDFDKIDN